jgi:hypothetical protein
MNSAIRFVFREAPVGGGEAPALLILDVREALLSSETT